MAAAHQGEEAARAGDGVVFNRNCSPDAVKAREVEKMEIKFEKSYPLLKKRFSEGTIFTDSSTVIKLILEVMDIILLPVQQCRGCPAVVLMGITGAGKSTFGNWLLERKLVKKQDEDDEDGDGVSIECEDAVFQVGAGQQSTTFVPNVRRMRDGTWLIDFPGFADTSGFEVRIGMDLAFRSMIDWLKPAHVIALVPIESFEAGRGTLLREQMSKIIRMLPSRGAPLSETHTASGEHACRWMVGVTKCDQDFVKKAKTKYTEVVKYLEDLEPQLSGHIINVNGHMFGSLGRLDNLTTGDRSVSAVSLKDRIKNDTTTPDTAHAELEAVLKSCFPSKAAVDELNNQPWWTLGQGSSQTAAQPKYPERLISDCLSPNDTAQLQHALSTFEFANHFFKVGDGKDAEDAVSFANGITGWSQATQAIQSSHTQLKKITDDIKRDSDNLMKYSILSVERRNAYIHELCLQRQCRLKLCFVEIEGKVLKSQMNFIQLTKKRYDNTVAELKEKGLLRTTDQERCVGKLQEVDEQFKQEVQAMGYETLAAFSQTAFTLLGSLSTVGGTGMLIHVCATSTSLGAFLSGTGSWAALSAGACAGLTLTAFLLAGGVVGFIAWKSMTFYQSYGDQHSSEIANLLIEGMEDIKAAHTACLQHIQKLDKIATSLRALEVIPKD